MNSRLNIYHLTGKCSWADITSYERNRQRDTLFLRLREGAHFVVWIWYGREKRLFLSDGFSEMVGLPKGQTPTLELLAECILPDDLEDFFGFMKGLVMGIGYEFISFRVCLPDGTVRKIGCEIGKMEREVVGSCYEV